MVYDLLVEAMNEDLNGQDCSVPPELELQSKSASMLPCDASLTVCWGATPRWGRSQ